jgi:pimeloyl-ACP methyl ester carboxylesterase
VEPTIAVVDGLPIAMASHRPDSPVPGLPLLVALHGGTYNSAYFEVAGGPLGSFVEIATRNGFCVLTIDRPGYGSSGMLPDAENTFERQAEILDEAVAQRLRLSPAEAVVLVGHSVGGMICLEIAARHPDWPLAGVSATGVGARITAGGAAEHIASMPLEGMVDLPLAERESAMLGPEGSVSAAGREAAQASYAPAPFVELVEPPVWARGRLRAAAAAVMVPVQSVLAQHDAFWDSSPAARAEFESLFPDYVPVTTGLIPGVGHSIDHHLLGAALHLQQLAFAYACAMPGPGLAALADHTNACQLAPPVS